MDDGAVSLDRGQINERRKWDVEAEEGGKLVERFVQDLGCAINEPVGRVRLVGASRLQRWMARIPEQSDGDTDGLEPECERDGERLEGDQRLLHPYVVGKGFGDGVADGRRIGEEAGALGWMNGIAVCWSSADDHGEPPIL